MGPTQPTSSGATVAIGRRALSARYRLGRARRGNTLMALLFLAPALLIYGLFMILPFFGTLYLSLTNWDGYAELAKAQFVGLDNDVQLLRDPDF